MLLGVVLTCYDAGANLRRGAEQNRSSEPEIFRSELDEDPEYREQRREFLDRFLGNRQGSVSAAAYKRALAEARALPPSPLLGGQTFRSAETPGAMAPWTSPIAPPIMNSYSANASAAVFSLAIDPINANTVYTGNPAGLAKTTDGGGTWRYLSDSVGVTECQRDRYQSCRVERGLCWHRQRRRWLCLLSGRPLPFVRWRVKLE